METELPASGSVLTTGDLDTPEGFPQGTLVSPGDCWRLDARGVYMKGQRSECSESLTSRTTMLPSAVHVDI